MTSVNYRSCIQWLVRCRVLPSDHGLVKGQEGSADVLVQLLKDGVILCSLLNRLKPSAIGQKAISHKPQTSNVIY